MMWQAIARIKGTEQWSHVTNMHMPFSGEKGIMEFLIEKMADRHPNIEYKLVEVK